MKTSAGTPGYMIAKYEAFPREIKTLPLSNDQLLLRAFHNAHPGFIPDFICENTTILNGSVDKNHAGNFRSVVYRDGEAIWAFYCLDAALFDPGDELESRWTNDNHYFFYSANGCTAVIWKVGGCYDALVGKSPLDAILEYAETIRR
ncbi:MAG: hypothetical protein GF315_03805 [candidate division Zixibacteria bacterium]|nr:hypothetical protein [candidate division Zixibacteria bacterium]